MKEKHPGYLRALSFLYGLEKRGVRLGLERMQQALRERDMPHAALSCVQVAGTNGKGSVSAMIERMAREAGIRTGLYTSPHLHCFGERIRVQGNPVSETEIAERLFELEVFLARATSPDLSFFELSTLLALEIFRDAKCELVVLETGLGGRLDASNVVSAKLAVITQVSIDHTELLGESLPQIAREKAGIIKQGVPVISAEQSREVSQVIEERAREQGSTLWREGQEFWSIEHTDAFDLHIHGEVLRSLQLRLLGQHQVHNAAVAAASCVALREAGYAIEDAAIQNGLAAVQWPARLESLAGEPEFLIDAAHNPAGCEQLARFVRQQKIEKRPRVLLFSAMADKDVQQMLQPLLGLFDAVIFLALAMPRALSAEALRKLYPSADVELDINVALRSAKHYAGSEGLVVVAGSIFLVAEVRAKLLDIDQEPTIRM